MESPSKKPDFVKLTRYNSSLLLCFFLSVGICCSILPFLPSSPAFMGSNQFPLTYSISRICLVLVILLLDVYFYRTISKAEYLHRNHEVFWPMRCVHCAQTVGLPPQSKQTRIRHFRRSSCRDVKHSHQRRHSAGDVILARRHSLKYSSEAESVVGEVITSYDACSAPAIGTCTHRKERMNKNVTTQREHYSLDKSCRKLNDEINIVPTANNSPVSSSWAVYVPRHEKASPLAFRGFDQDVIDKLHHHRPLYKKPHKSILNIYIVFSVISAINIILQIVGLLICVKENNPPLLEFVLVTELLLDIGFMTVILLGTTFFCMYYDAVFLEEERYAYHIGIMFSGCIWVAITKILHPLNTILGFTYDTHHDYPCKASGNFGDFLLMDATLLTPFYAECGIIGAGLVWQIWTSILPRSSLRITCDEPRFETFDITPATPFWSGSLARVMTLCKGRRYRRSTLDERESLLTKMGRSRYSWPLLSSSTVVSILTGTIYIGLIQFIRNAEYADLTDATKAYIQMCIEMAFYLPAIGLYRYRNILCDSFKRFAVKKNILNLHDLIEGHDRILLLSCVGIFTFNIFRFIGSVGLLFGASSVPPDQIALTCFTIVFSLFRMYALWQMTSFVCVVQRQMVRGIKEIEITMICLAYTGVLNATQWLLDSVNIDLWVELTVYYGDIPGEVIGFLLEPISSLYGIHAAMLAMEAYRSMRMDTNANLQLGISKA